MKIAPIAASGMTIGNISAGQDPQATRIQSVRALRMNTNATPGREEVAPPAVESQPELAISDNIDPANATVEATQPLSPQFAELAKRKRALQAKERELSDREKALETRSPTQGDAVDMARLKSEPLSVLLEAGVTYDQLTEAILANQNGITPEIQALKSKLAELEQGLDKKFVDRDQQAEQQVLAQMKRDATALVAEGDDFEMVRETGSIPDVMQLIEKTYRETGEVLDVREALDLVETELVNESLKVARLKKVQSQLTPQAPVPAQGQPQRQMRTLTNRDTAAVPMSAKQRALAAFHGNLKR